MRIRAPLGVVVFAEVVALVGLESSLPSLLAEGGGAVPVERDALNEGVELDHASDELLRPLVVRRPRHLPALDEGTYPDASVVCGPFLSAPEDPEATVNPAALFEVLSPTTEAYDRGEKFAKYQRLASFREYVLVSQDKPRIERYLRGDDRTWIWRAYAAGERVPLACAGVDIAVDDVYAGAFDQGDAPST